MLFSGPPDEAGDALTLCIDCVLGIPDIGRGMGLARQRGVATRIGDTWTASMSVEPHRRGWVS